ncbi:Rof/RNase P-like protein [Bisporella sp. PMI_857]|nr:Rof/RNase P-like protein [Bisporella sp. PMI_857]
MAPKETNVAISLLSRAHSPDSTSRIYTQKIATRPLHLKPTAPDNAQLLRRRERLKKLANRKKKLKPRPLSSRQKRALGLYDIPPASQKYGIYEPLHKMWTGYIHEILGENRPVSAATAAKLCSAEFVGAEVEVVRSRCVSRVGVRGIVVKDSKFTFEVVTRGDAVKVLPKEGTVFRVAVPEVSEGRGGEGGGEDDKEGSKDLVFELHGDQFIFRAADRANRKFKPKYLPDL